LVRAGNIVTLPNLISLSRLCLLPFYVLLLRDGRVVAAAFLLGGLSATDWVDGWVARRFNQVSEFGKVFDPVVDRLVFLVGATTPMITGDLTLWFGVPVVAREATIALLMVGGTVLGMERFPVSRSGKWATFALMCAVPWITIGAAGGVWDLVEVVGWAVGVPGLILSWVVLGRYLPSVRDGMAAGRRSRAVR
jgi:cardiolipin synthase